jgi:hypothetical protein
VRLRYAVLQPDFGSPLRASDARVASSAGEPGSAAFIPQDCRSAANASPTGGGTTHTTNRSRLIAVGERIDEEIRQMFRTEVDLIPDEENKSLTVRLHPMTTQGSRRNRAPDLRRTNSYKSCFPGTDLHRIYEISGSR